ncbi:hypothetical protein RJT34_24682 [Clitoria ternatea]|uniref:Uncharacterized protein n=1 Tax=Clitoria ternatea TaxID=43366 RepID=A0AAN9FNC2_CLITE
MYMRSIVCKGNNGKLFIAVTRVNIRSDSILFYFMCVNNMLQISWLDLYPIFPSSNLKKNIMLGGRSEIEVEGSVFSAKATRSPP